MKQAWQWLKWLFSSEGKTTLLWFMVLTIIGIICIWQGQIQNISLLEKIGTFTFTGSLVQLIVRSNLWFETNSELKRLLQISRASQDLGLSNFWWYPEIPWKDLFESSNQVTLVGISLRDFIMGDKASMVKDFLRRSDTHLTIVIANPENDDLMNALDHLHQYPSNQRKQSNTQILSELDRFIQEIGAKDRTFVRLFSNAPRYSCFIFNDSALFVPYLTKPIREPGKIPAICIKQGAFKNKYLDFDIAYILGEGSVDRASSK